MGCCRYASTDWTWSAIGTLASLTMIAMQFGARVISLSSVAFAFYMDRQKEERERGVTIACTPKEFYTDKWHYTVIDARPCSDCRSFLFGSAPQPNPYWAGYSRAVAIGSRPPAQPLLGTIKHGELIGWN